MIILMFLFSFIFGYNTAHNIYKMFFWLIILACIFLLLLSLDLSVTGDINSSLTVLENEVFNWNALLSIIYGVMGFFLGAWLKTKSLEWDK